VGLNAALATHYGAVPALATGDDTLVREAEDIAPGITTVTVKTAVGTRAAESLHPVEACARIEAAAKVALDRIGKVDAPHFDGPVDLEVDLLRPHMTELACLIPGVEQRGPLTLGYHAADFASAYDLIDVFAVLAGAR
jgi:D-amino peptidase